MMSNELQARYNKVLEIIRNAALKAERNPEDIQLIPVSKNQGIEDIKELYNEGIKVFGENRVQELQDKDEKMRSTNIKWHFIGHLQRNKVKYLLRMDNCLMIESLDSWRLAREINKRAKENNRKMPVLVEVNVSGDENKFGLKPEKTAEFVKKAGQLKYLDVQGLMTIAPYLENVEKTRPYFRKLAELREELNKQNLNISELSMGMSNDFHIAVEEGSTIVRVGTAIFGERNY